MRTVILGERPAVLEELIERRRKLGLDRHDEVWEGEYHMSPAAHSWHAFVQATLLELLGPLARAQGFVAITDFNLGDHRHDFRVPDLGVHASLPDAVWVPTALLVVEVLSPDDESWQKLGFYAARGVREVLLADPKERTVTWLARNAAGDGYDEVTRSEVLGVEVAEVVAGIAWPG